MISFAKPTETVLYGFCSRVITEFCSHIKNYEVFSNFLVEHDGFCQCALTQACCNHCLFKNGAHILLLRNYFRNSQMIAIERLVMNNIETASHIESCFTVLQKEIHLNRRSDCIAR